VAILTSENTDIVLARAEKLQIEEVYVDEHEKFKRINYLAKKYEISMDEVAFIGDDVNDLQALKAVGFSGLSGNSPIQDQFTPDYITKRHGGYGAFREFVDLILKSQ
jgi:YrbI family 3-deoxy-D-manno-octulosonate 8-phosphate phosphatase